MTRQQALYAVTALIGLVLFHPEQLPAVEPNPDSPAAKAAGAAPGTAEQAAGAAAKTNRIIVKYRQDAAALKSSQSFAASVKSLNQRAGVSLRHLRAAGGNTHILTLDAPRSEAEVRAIAERIAQDPDVEYAEPDAIMRIQQNNDPQFVQQWHYYQPKVGINVVPAWQIKKDVVVAVIDTGIRPHADLVKHILKGYDFITDVTTANDGDGRDADASDPGDWCPPLRPTSSWHGTHVAGTIAAVTNNALGVAGVALNARILPVRVLGKCGGYLSDIADGMRWAAGLPVPGVPANPKPARVLNLSLGGGGACGPTYADAISAVRKKGVTIVVAAGNSNSDAGMFRPANCDGVITVAATNRQGARAWYSNFGKAVEIAAPGGETMTALADGVLSTLNSGATTPGADSYQFYQGTSMAAPHVAAVAAMLYGLKPTITPDEVLLVLQKTAQPFPAVASQPCDTSICGAGILNAHAAVDWVITH